MTSDFFNGQRDAGEKAEYTERRLCVQEGEEHGATI